MIKVGYRFDPYDTGLAPSRLTDWQRERGVLWIFGCSPERRFCMALVSSGEHLLSCWDRCQMICSSSSLGTKDYFNNYTTGMGKGSKILHEMDQYFADFNNFRVVEKMRFRSFQ